MGEINSYTDAFWDKFSQLVSMSQDEQIKEFANDYKTTIISIADGVLKAIPATGKKYELTKHAIQLANQCYNQLLSKHSTSVENASEFRSDAENLFIDFNEAFENTAEDKLDTEGLTSESIEIPETTVLQDTFDTLEVIESATKHLFNNFKEGLGNALFLSMDVLKALRQIKQGVDALSTIKAVRSSDHVALELLQDEMKEKMKRTKNEKTKIKIEKEYKQAMDLIKKHKTKQVGIINKSISES